MVASPRVEDRVRDLHRRAVAATNNGQPVVGGRLIRSAARLLGLPAAAPPKGWAAWPDLATRVLGTYAAVETALGNSARGAFRGPSMQTVDVAATKKVALKGSARLELRLEVFNIFNRDNFGNPTLIAFAGAAANEAPLASFGRIRSTVTTARQMQLGARVSF